MQYSNQNSASSLSLYQKNVEKTSQWIEPSVFLITKRHALENMYQNRMMDVSLMWITKEAGRIS